MSLGTACTDLSDCWFLSVSNDTQLFRQETGSWSWYCCMAEPADRFLFQWYSKLAETERRESTCSASQVFILLLF